MKKLTDEELEARQAAVPTSSWWRDRDGGIYFVTGVCITEATPEPAVTYLDRGRPVVWCRPLAEFLDGRFTRLPGPPADWA